MAKQVDARDLKSLGKTRPGSIPGERTIVFELTISFLDDKIGVMYVYEPKWSCSLARSKPSAHN